MKQSQALGMNLLSLFVATLLKSTEQRYRAFCSGRASAHVLFSVYLAASLSRGGCSLLNCLPQRVAACWPNMHTLQRLTVVQCVSESFQRQGVVLHFFSDFWDLVRNVTEPIRWLSIAARLNAVQAEED
eukprot:6362539-Amphidinium_carterae.2